MAYGERNPPFQALPLDKSATIFVIILQKYARKQAKQSKKCLECTSPFIMKEEFSPYLPSGRKLFLPFSHI